VAAIVPMLILVAGWLLPLLVGNAYEGAVPIAQILVLAAGPATLRTILIVGAQAYGDWRVQAVSEIAGLVCLLLCLLAGGWLGPLTAAAALSAAAGVSLAACIYESRRRFGIEPSSLWPFTRATIADVATI